jgi:hypothetical protein
MHSAQGFVDTTAAEAGRFGKENQASTRGSALGVPREYPAKTLGSTPGVLHEHPEVPRKYPRVLWEYRMSIPKYPASTLRVLWEYPASTPREPCRSGQEN